MLTSFFERVESLNVLNQSQPLKACQNLISEPASQLRVSDKCSAKSEAVPLVKQHIQDAEGCDNTLLVGILVRYSDRWNFGISVIS